jgi:hypothetical protein
MPIMSCFVVPWYGYSGFGMLFRKGGRVAEDGQECCVGWVRMLFRMGGHVIQDGRPCCLGWVGILFRMGGHVNDGQACYSRWADKLFLFYGIFAIYIYIYIYIYICI